MIQESFLPMAQLVMLGKIPQYQPSVELLSRCKTPQEFAVAWEKIPFTKKQDIPKNFPNNFGFTREQLNDLVAQEKIELEHTSGTTEDSVELILPQGWWAKQEARALCLNAYIHCTYEPDPQFADALMPPKRVNIVSPSCNNDVCFTGVPSPEARTLGRTLFVNLSKHPFLWTDTAKQQMLEETLAFEPIFLDVDPVYGILFAEYCRKNSTSIPSLKFILSSYEYLSRAHRLFLREVFGVPVYNLYGSTETGHLLIENETGMIRPVKENALLEFLPSEVDDTMKECVVTTLTNPYMPLLRYRIGDLVCKRDERFRLMGRLKDAAHTQGGGVIPVAWLDDAITVCNKIIHYQFVQVKAPFQWRLDYLLRSDASDLTKLEKELISNNVTTFLGWNTKIEFHNADYIPCEPSGKFRLVVPSAL